MTQNFHFYQKLTNWSLASTFLLPIMRKSWTRFSRATQSHWKLYHTRSVRRMGKLKFKLQMEDLALPSSARTWDFFQKLCCQWFWSYVERKKTSGAKYCKGHCSQTLSPDIYRPDWVKFSWIHIGSNPAVLSFHMKSKNGRRKLKDSTWTIRYLKHYTLDCYSKHLGKVFALTWETRAVKNTPCNCRYHSIFFDV